VTGAITALSWCLRCQHTSAQDIAGNSRICRTHRTSNRSQGHRRRVTHWENICTKHWGYLKSSTAFRHPWLWLVPIQGRNAISTHWDDLRRSRRWASDRRSPRNASCLAFSSIYSEF